LLKAHQQLNAVVVDHDAKRLAKLTNACRNAGLLLAQGTSSAESAADLFSRNPLAPALAIVPVDGAGPDPLALMQRLVNPARRLPLLLVSSLPPDVIESLQQLASIYGLAPIGAMPASFDDSALIGTISRAAFVDDAGFAPEIDPPAASPPEIEDACRRNLIEPWFQPQLEIRTGRIVGVEALLRWRLEEGSTRLPQTFLPHLEAAGLLRGVTLRVIACAAECIGLIVGRTRDFRVSINVSPELLALPGFAAELHTTALNGGARPQQIVVEIDESALREPSRSLLETLTRLRLLGFGVCIDNYLRNGAATACVAHGPFTQWKIANEYAAVTPAGSRTWNVVESAIQLAHKLGVTAVAGGVETPAQLEALLHLRADVVQGFMVAPAMPILGFMQWMDRRTRASTTDVSSLMLTGHFESTEVDRTSLPGGRAKTAKR
jgi:EAL domain-containing protein (putative c-di-GMP-specific phosphodiesterase class I)